MTWIEALVLGILQGLTEFLPVSSSGHLELGTVLFGLEDSDNLTFSVLVHGATVLSIIVVFYKDIWNLIRNFFKFQWNDETRFVLMLLVSAVPTGIVGLLFEDKIEAIFTGQVIFVGAMLLVTSLLLFLTIYAPQTKKEVNFKSAFIIGLAQTIAVLPGISRAGATIATALYLGIDKEKATRFSFLMVLIPIIGATFLRILKISGEAGTTDLSFWPLAIGFVAAFVSGLWACSKMLSIVRKGKLVYFAIYTLVAGLTAITAGVFM